MKMSTHLCNREDMKGEVEGEEEKRRSRRNRTMLCLLMLGR